MLWQIIGMLAAVLTMFSFVPQIVKVYKTKSADDLSLGMLIQLSLGVFLWLVYGIHLKNAVIILANSVTFLSLSLLVFFYLLYGKSGKKI
ncbi:MAG: SemiSWEET transporter [Candidatus Omnitrophica bacterium]|nr:SemiSWEET transporter [Candidatus Omnitrophota bacterium]